VGRLRHARKRPINKIKATYTVAYIAHVPLEPRDGGLLPRRRQQFVHDRLQLLADLRLGSIG